MAKDVVVQIINRLTGSTFSQRCGLPVGLPSAGRGCELGAHDIRGLISDIRRAGVVTVSLGEFLRIRLGWVQQSWCWATVRGQSAWRACRCVDCDTPRDVPVISSGGCNPDDTGVITCLLLFGHSPGSARTGEELYGEEAGRHGRDGQQ